MENSASVNAVALKLPPFWTTQPEIWFAQCEAQFLLRNVTVDDTKFAYIISSLDSTSAAEVSDIILHPPRFDKYDLLKNALIKAFGRTQEEKDAALLQIAGLGDRKPSALLRHMKSLNSDPATLFRALFLSQLPVEVRRVLAVNTTATIEILADEADHIMAAGRQLPPMNTVDGKNFDNVSAFGQQKKTRTDVQRFSRNNGTNLAQVGLDANGVCAYHVRFNADSVRCITGCRYAKHVTPTVSGNASTGRR
jgi:hypothetical protein